MSPAGSWPGWLSASHWRSSSRKASSWGESVRSTARALYTGRPGFHRGLRPAAPTNPPWRPLRASAADGLEERRGHSLVELAAHRGTDLLTRRGRRQRAPVGAVGGHGVVGVADQDHARAERDRVAG